jgi:hypothetical protein
MRIDAIPIGKNPPDDINVIIEVPVGGEPIKYEMDKEAGTLFVDRFLYTPMRYPGNYGFVPHYAVRGWRPDRRAGGEYPADHPRRGDQRPPGRRGCGWKTMAAGTRRSSPCRPPS